MNRSESKFHNTTIKFNKALLRLLDKKDFKEITASEICKEAGVNRSTFYAHYENTYDLLEETKNNTISQFMEGFNSKLELNNLKKYSLDDLVFVSPEYLIPYLQFIKDNKNFFRVYMSNLKTFSVDEIDDYLTNSVFAPIYEKSGITDKNVIKYMSRYFLSGITAIVMQWVSEDCADDIILISEIITLCVRPNHRIMVDL